MKILIISESFYPAISGVSIMAERLATKMSERGHQVYVLAPGLNRSYHKEERKGYLIYRIPSWRNPLRRGFRYTLFPQKYVHLAMREIQPDIVHAQDPASLSTAGVKYAKKQNIPVVITNHFTFDYILTYLPHLKPIHPLINAVLQKHIFRFYNLANVLTVPTQTVKDYLQNASQKKSPIKRPLRVPIEVISNGVDVARFSLYYAPNELIQRYHLLSAPLITFVGRLDPEKNISTLLKALAKVKASYQVVILGSGNCLDALRKEANDLGLDKKITWIPKLDNQSSLLNQLYYLTKIFCMPSLTETESMVTMEAMASGLPVLASNVGALPELVESGLNGYLLPTNEPEQWSAKIEYLLTHEKERQGMALQSIEKIAQRDLNKTLAQFEGLYAREIEANS